MDGQMSLWDLFQPTYPDINTIPEQEAVRMVGEAIGLAFIYCARLEEWQARKGPQKLYLRYDHFNGVFDNALFLGVMYSRGTAGGGSPCGGIEEAIEWFKRKMEDDDE